MKNVRFPINVYIVYMDFPCANMPIPILMPKYWTEQILYNFKTHQTIPKPGSVFLLPTKISLPFVVGPQKINSFKQADWTYMDLLKALHVAVPAMKLQAPWIPGEESENRVIHPEGGNGKTYCDSWLLDKSEWFVSKS